MKHVRDGGILPPIPHITILTPSKSNFHLISQTTATLDNVCLPKLVPPNISLLPPSPSSSDPDPSLPPTAAPPSVQPVLYPACWQNTQDTEQAGQEQQEQHQMVHQENQVGQVHRQELLKDIITEQ